MAICAVLNGPPISQHQEPFVSSWAVKVKHFVNACDTCACILNQPRHTQICFIIWINSRKDFTLHGSSGSLTVEDYGQLLQVSQACPAAGDM